MKALIFDLDGTLIDSVYPHTLAWQQTLNEAGLRVPENVAVVGFDNLTPLAEFSQPPLTTISVDWAAVGQRAADCLHRQVIGEEVENAGLCPVNLVVRRSCGCAVK